MKKVSLIVSCLVLFTSISKSQDKAFKKGDIAVSLGAGTGIYLAKAHTEFNSKRYNSQNGSIETVRLEEDYVDGISSLIFPIHFEYAVNNWLGTGLRFAYSDYPEFQPSWISYKSKTYNFDSYLSMSFHFVKSPKFDMPIILFLGYSVIRHFENDPPDSRTKANGLNYGISIQPNFYFGKHIGIFLNVGLAGFRYPNVIFSDKFDNNINDNNDKLYQITGLGVNTGFGLIAKF
jgi:hypothetical protein